MKYRTKDTLSLMKPSTMRFFVLKEKDLDKITVSDVIKRVGCEYTITNPFLANLLKNPEGGLFFEKAITMFHRYVAEVMQNTTPPYHSKEEFSYMIACVIGSTIGVLHKWSTENFQVPADVIADILTQSFMAVMLPFIS